MSKINYDEDVVYYCNSCFSLKILNSSGVEDDIEDDPVPCHCGVCGSTDISTSLIEDYLELTKESKIKIKKRY